MDAPKWIISTHSLSCIQALHNIKLGHRLIGLVILNSIIFSSAIKEVGILRVPGHVVIRRNGKTDVAAKAALDLLHTKLGILYRDFKHCITQYILRTGQHD